MLKVGMPKQHISLAAGDIRKQDNIAALWEDCRTWFEEQGVPGAALVTADGSIDCQEHPNEQEAMTASLHYAELVAALGVLAPGGSVFLKSFTIFEHSSFALLYICGVFFDRVHCPPRTVHGCFH
jgi:cap2 methyltransferase